MVGNVQKVCLDSEVKSKILSFVFLKFLSITVHHPVFNSGLVNTLHKKSLFPYCPIVRTKNPKWALFLAGNQSATILYFI